MKCASTRRAALTALLLAACLPSGPSMAQSTEPYIGDIIWVPYTFCPYPYAEANGQVLSISQNQALFSLFGTTYGGDGQTTFNLPDMRGRVPVGVGEAPGLTPILQGEKVGAEYTTLSFNQMASHTHAATTTVTGVQIASVLRGSTAANTTASPAGAALGASISSKKVTPGYAVGTPTLAMAPGSVQSTVTDGTATTTVNATNTVAQPFGIREPYFAIRACVAMEGLFPPR